jgi:lipopolysaccharide assembly protein A
MRFIQAVIFLVLLGVIIIFAVQNSQIVTVQFLNWSVSSPIALMSVGVYLLGMLSGWTVVGFMGRSVRRVAERHEG